LRFALIWYRRQKRNKNCSMWDLNTRLSAHKTDTLPTELMELSELSLLVENYYLEIYKIT
jgi:hypothetical protein